ncbi:MAG: hypothetical protein PHQ89_05155 [Bacilli bacterium]|nr:hypothetical protein [Bacilli bacterium]
MEKKGYVLLDIMKIVCIGLLLCMYTELFSSYNETIDFVFIQIFVKLAFPFLITYISFSFFKKIDFSLSLASQQNFNTFITGLAQIGKSYLLWTLIYLPLVIIKWIKEGFTIMSLFAFLRDVLFVGSYPHLWIFPALILAVFLVYYLIQRFTLSDLLVISFLFYLIGMLFNVYGSFLQGIPLISNILKLYISIFATSINGLFFAFIFVLLGLKLSLKNIPLKTSPIIIKVILSASLYCLEVVVLKWLGYVNIHTQMYLFLVPFVYFLFMWLMQYQGQVKSKYLSNFMSLIYLVHFYGIALFSSIEIFNDHKLFYFIGIILFSCLVSWGILKAAEKQRKLQVLYLC